MLVGERACKASETDWNESAAAGVVFRRRFRLCMDAVNGGRKVTSWEAEKE